MSTQAGAAVIDRTGGYSIWRVILASAVGTMIEWYDFYIFGSLTAVLTLKFYPPATTPLLMSLISPGSPWASWCGRSAHCSSVASAIWLAANMPFWSRFP